MKRLARCHLQFAILLLVFSTAAGCLTPWLKDEKSGKLKSLVEAQEIEKPDVVGQVARAAGLNFARVEAVALVNNLAGTGGIPEPGRQRDELIREIRTHDIPDVNQYVDSPNTAMIIVDGSVPPGIRDGEFIDLTIRPSRRTVASSLHGGWLMPARLREMRLLGGEVRTSDVLGTGIGPVVTLWDTEGGDDPQKKLEGVVVGGGHIMKKRPLALTLRRQPAATLQDRQEMISSVVDAINERFFFFDGSKQRGVANAKSDEFIELDVHDSYRRNIRRFMTVIDRTPMDFVGPKRAAKIASLTNSLMDPATAAESALTLEALGRDDGREVLKSGLKSNEKIVRFVSAEALAYLDDRVAIPVLAEFAKNEPDMRHNALRALSVHAHRDAGDALANLLHELSNETRYGALRELLERKDGSSHLAIRKLPGNVELVLIPSTTAPLVAISTIRKPMVAIFGVPIAVCPTKGCILGDGLSARCDESGRLRLSWFQAGKEDRMLLAPANMEGFVAGLCEMGVPYGSLIAAVRMLKEGGHLDARLAFDPLPKSEAERMEKETEQKAMEEAATVEEEKKLAPVTAANPWWNARGWFAGSSK